MTNTGHAHPRVAAAIAAQAAKLLHGQQNIVYHEPGLRLYERLPALLPGGPWQAFLANSGAEAVEASVKLARVATGPAGDHRVPLRLPRPDRPDDGADRPPRTSTAAPSSRCRAASTTPPTRTATGRPAAPTIRRHAPATGRSSSTCCSTSSSTRSKVAAIIVEPVLGEGGYIVPPPGFLPRLREITRAARDPAHRRRGPDRVRPDRRDVRGPALGRRAGHPRHGQGHRVGPAAVRHPRPDRDHGALEPGTHGGTYGGNVVSCAAANATLDVIEDEGLVANARERGAPVPGRAPRAGRPPPAIGDVRGLGLMVAIELVKPGVGDGRVPDPDLTKRIQAEALARNLIVLTAGHLRERDPDHPAAGDDPRGGRPGAGDPRREPDRRGRLSGSGATAIRHRGGACSRAAPCSTH